MTKKARAIGQARLFKVAPIGKPEVPDIEAAMSDAGLPPPEAEFHFAPDRGWRFDYAWPALKIALEIEGGSFGRLVVIQRGYERRKGKSIPIAEGTRIRFGGRHNDPAGMQTDCIKYNRAAVLGWCVIRATTTMVRDGIALEHLRSAFAAHGFTPPGQDGQEA